MRMRKISEKVPNLEDLVQKLLLVQGSGVPFFLGNLQRHKLQPHVQLRTVDDYAVMSMVERARAQYPPGTNPAPDSLQNRHPPARRSGQPDARSCAAQRRAHAACRPLLSGLSPLPELENRLDCQNSRAGDFYAIFRDVRPLPGGS